jgi:hypothetical protein
VKQVLVPASLSLDDTFHPVSRRYSHGTLLTGLSTAGDALPPMTISGMPIRASLWESGLGQDEDAMIRSRTSAYIDADSFYESISAVFVPYVTNVRNNPTLANEQAFLSMDSVCPHVAERVLRLPGENQIITLICLAQATIAFQALSLLFFGGLKKLKQTAYGDDDDKTMNHQISRLIQAEKQTETSLTFRGS